MKQKLLFIFLVLCPFCTHAQNEYNIWYFGHKAGVNFNTGTAVALVDGQMFSNEAGCTISSATGELLFYTNGVIIWNKEHTIMTNGTGIMGSSSSSQGALILKKPNSSSIYYVFTTGAVEQNEPFYFSEVDITLSNGNGSVVSKNNMLLPITSEHLTAARHANGVDYWIIVHGYGDNRFYSYLLSSSGISTTPVVTETGDPFVGPYVQGYMKVSPQGDKLAVATNGSLQLFSFNNSTGVISNRKKLSSEPNCYGVEFSYLGEVLYYTNMRDLFQFDLTVENIVQSKVKLSSFASGIQLAPDRKIYVVGMYPHSIGVIHNPDVIGTDCDFEESSVYLEGKFSFLGLSSVVNSHFLEEGIYTRGKCENTPVRFMFNTTQVPDSIHWDFGNGTTSDDIIPYHIFNTPGMHTVTASVKKGGLVRVFTHIINIYQQPQAGHAPDLWSCGSTGNNRADFNLSTQNNILLAGQPASDYTINYYTSQQHAEEDKWGLSDSFFSTSLAETVIYARVTSKATGCYAIRSFKLMAVAPPVINMQTEYKTCNAVAAIVTAPPGYDSYQWSSGQTTREVTLPPGIYTLIVTVNYPQAVCSTRKTITVLGLESPQISDIIVDDWNGDNNSITVITLNTQPMLYSLDGINYQESNVFSGLAPGFYTVYVKDMNDCNIVTKDVSILMYPRFFTPNNDGINDIWRIKYAILEPGIEVYIYDRYGKFLKFFKGNSDGWDGKYAGVDMPATDYWFVLKRSNGKIYKGHFALKR